VSSVEEELHEHVEHAKHPFDKKVAATMAAVAAALAIVAVMGHLATTEELLNQQKASDQWAFYQAKNIRRYESEIARDMMLAMKSDKADAYAKNAARYDKETKEIQTEAKALEDESHLAGRKALRFHFGEIFLEIAIVLASLAILTKREMIWVAAVIGALTGIAIAASMLLVK
jgi:ABC-type Zn uptake system ZnuABC Zn-binding protein ZnuA